MSTCFDCPSMIYDENRERYCQFHKKNITKLDVCPEGKIFIYVKQLIDKAVDDVEDSITSDLDHHKWHNH